MLLANSNAIGAASSGGATGNERSVRLRKSSSAYFSRTFGTPTNNKKWTISCWVKRGALDATNQAIMYSGTIPTPRYDGLRFLSNDKLELNAYSEVDNKYIQTAAVFRDPAEWLHVVAIFDSANATAADREILYVNNVRQTISSSVTVTQNAGAVFNSAGQQHFIGANFDYFDGYLADFYFIDGQALDPSYFGQLNTNNIWVPKAYTGTYGNNGFKLDFRDIATTSGSNAGLGKDTSGNGNYWNTNNISVTSGVTYDSMYDYPVNAASGTQPVGNYPTLNPLSSALTGGPSLVDGNLKVSGADGTYWRTMLGTIAIPTTGIWYWEFETDGGADQMAGIVSASRSFTGSTTGFFDLADGYAFRANSTKFNNGTPTAYGSNWSTNVIGVLYNADTRVLKFFVADSDQGAAFTVSAGTYIPAYALTSGPQNAKFNFGQRPFFYSSRPTTEGAKALCTSNMPDTAVTTSGSFTGNVSTDGPFVWCAGNPTAMTINGNAVTFGTHADKLANGFKVRSSSSSYNASGSNTFSVTAGDKFSNNNRAQSNP